MAKNSPNKRKSQNNVVQTPKKQKLNEVNQKTPKGENKNNTPKSQKKNVQKEKLQKFSGTANLQEKIKEEVESTGEESDYEVEQEVKPEKISKSMNEDNQDSDEVDDSEDQDDNDDDDDNEETDNVVNENSENDENQSKVDKIEDIEAFIKSETANGKKMRYVLFIGNLPYVITPDEIKNHFKNGINIRNVRLPRQKGPDKKLRGFGYLELSDKESYLKAFSMHHTFINGRRINVLYTTGRKKNSAETKSIIKKKNFKLDALRKAGKLEGCQKHSQKRSVRRAKKRSFEKKTE